MRYITSALLSLAVTSTAFGQAIVGPLDIKSTDLGHTPVPRFAAIAAYPNNHVVPAGTVETLPAVFDYDAIEVSGTLKLSRDYDTSGRFIVIQVLPGGSLDFGTPTDPVLRKVKLVIKDTPLLTGTLAALGPDPEQFGNAIHVFGEFKSHGLKLDNPWLPMQPVVAGETVVTLIGPPVGWQVGDSLLIPDTRQPSLNDPVSGIPNLPIRRESPVTITAINGNKLTLSKPLDFEHNDIRVPSTGELMTLPFVANCTRNIVIQSENPNGTRGHVMAMDMGHMNTYYTSFIGLGRTLPKTINNFDSHTGHIGTNQIARYALHWHHVHGHADEFGYTGYAVGCYLDGTDVNKWGVVQHATHDLLITDNISERFVGACFTTAEDGYEIRGKYLRNFACGAKGNGDNGKNNVVVNNAPGAEGAGFWGHGSGSTQSGNVAINCHSGVSIVHQGQVLNHLVPSIPGGIDDTAYDPRTSVPISFDTQILACNSHAAFEGWKLPFGWIVKSCKLLNSNDMGYDDGSGENGYTTIKDSWIVNATSGIYSKDVGIQSGSGYTVGLDVQGTPIEGFRIGMGDIKYEKFTLKNCRLRNREKNINWSDVPHEYQSTILDTVKFEKMLDSAITPGVVDTVHISIGDGSVGQPIGVAFWHGGIPLTQADVDGMFTVTTCMFDGVVRSGKLYENYWAPASAVAIAGLVNAKIVLADQPPPPPPPPTNNPPVVSAITANPPDVDLLTPGVQEYEGSTVIYSGSASDPDGDSVTWTWTYLNQTTGVEVTHSTGTGPVQPASYTYLPGSLAPYLWRLTASDGKLSSRSELTVQVIAKPVTPLSDWEQLAAALAAWQARVMAAKAIVP